jgi:rhodanese-related sulfurtransferase
MEISVEELKAKLDNNEDIVVIDVREPYEYEEFNIGAKLIPLGEMQSRIGDIEEWMEKEIIVHCRSGARSAAAQQFLMQNEFKNVKNLTGGMMAWIDTFGTQQS